MQMYRTVKSTDKGSSGNNLDFMSLQIILFSFWEWVNNSRKWPKLNERTEIGLTQVHVIQLFCCVSDKARTKSWWIIECFRSSAEYGDGFESKAKNGWFGRQKSWGFQPLFFKPTINATKNSKVRSFLLRTWKFSSSLLIASFCIKGNLLLYASFWKYLSFGIRLDARGQLIINQREDTCTKMPKRVVSPNANSTSSLILVKE